MSYALLSETFPVARKQHRCIWCGEAIPVGMKHRRERSVFDGNMQDFRWHDECAQAQQDEIRASGEPEFSAYENERPVAHGVEVAPAPLPQCPFCGERHRHCDSPGAIITGTTGCEKVDGPARERLAARGVQASGRPPHEFNRCGYNHWTKKVCPARNCPWQGKRPVDAGVTEGRKL